MEPAAPPSPPTSRGRLRELAALFLRLGATSFGGPAAHIAMMEDEVVRRRRWLTPDEFLDLLGAVNLIPGPNSTELAIHVGLRRAGVPGLLVAGACFIAPAVAIVLAIAWAYARWGTLPTAHALMAGVKPVVIAVVAQAVWRLARTAVKTPPLAALGLAVALASALGADELALLLTAGALWAGAAVVGSRLGPPPNVWAAAPLTLLAAPTLITAAPTASAILLVFLKIGSVLFGSGYVLIALLRTELVERRAWLTDSQLIDAVAVGQFTPGPVFTAATFVGYVLHGPTGAAAATVGIFLPAFLFVALSAPFVHRLRRSPVAAAALDAVNVASLALMAVAGATLARAAVTDWFTLALALAALGALLRWGVNSAWLVLVGAVAGVLRAQL